jgi:ATP-dependent Lon protease
VIKDYYSIEELTLPLIPLRGIYIFPYMVIHFDVGRDKSIKALEKAMLDESYILLCSQKDPKLEEPSEDDFHYVGTVSKVRQMLKLPGGSIRVLVEGVNRGRVVNILDNDEYFEAKVENLIYEPDQMVVDKDTEAAMRLIVTDFEEYIEFNQKISPELSTTVVDVDDPGRLADIIASYVSLKPEDYMKEWKSFMEFYRKRLNY